MHIEQKVNIHNRFDVEVRDAKTGELKQKATGFNIVLDQMWTRLCGGSSYFVNIHFGTGGGTLSPSRTSLFTHLGTKTAADEEQVKALPVSRWKRKIVLNPEEFVGSTITEVGIAFGSTASNLVTHAMLKDSEGNPISITKTDLDVVTIYATVFITFGTNQINFLNVPSNTNALINYLFGSSFPTGSFGLKEVLGTPTRLGSTANVTWTTDVPNKKRKTNVPRFGIDTANGHVRAFEFTNVFEHGFPSAIFAGQDYENVPLGTGDGVKTKFTIPSRNINVSTLLVKKDGIVDTSYNLPFKHHYALVTPSGFGSYPFYSNGDGTIIVLPTPTLRILNFESASGGWTTLKTTNYNCLYVIISSLGNVIAIYDNVSATIKVFDWDGSDLIERPTLPNLISYTSNMRWAISENGNTLAIVNDAKNPKIYDWNGTTWSERTLPSGIGQPDRVGLSKNGLVLACGYSSGSPYFRVYDWNGTTWTLRPDPPSKPTYCQDITLSDNGNVLAVASWNVSPKSYAWDWNGTAWTSRAAVPNQVLYGKCVALSGDGNILFVGGFSSAPGIVAYRYENASWTTLALDSSLSTRYPDRIMVSSDGSTFVAEGVVLNSDEIKEYDVVFNIPPSSGQVITANYRTNGVHKTNQYVIDASFAIAFGEGA